jgi:tetratricopeptide (TPR) repeat protein
MQEVSMLERGVRRTPRSTTVEFLAAALQLDAQQKEMFIAAARGKPALDGIFGDWSPEPLSECAATLADAHALLASMPIDTMLHRAPLPAGSRVPLAPNPLFVGRGRELLEVATALRGSDTAMALGRVVASTGLGGLGKTQLAVEFVHRYGRFFRGGVFWLSFANVDEIPLQVAACAGPRAMDLATGIESLPLEERVQHVQRAWQSAIPRLLVFDNCEEEGLLEAWRPPSGGCRVLVTSRRSHWSPTLGVTNLPLDLLSRAESIELLRRYRPDLAPGDTGLDTIANELGDLPLALHLAASYLRAYRADVRVDEYLAELRQPAVLQHASLLGEGLDDTPSPTHHVQGVAQTFALCLNRLDRSRDFDCVAIALLARMACMAPGEPVPRNLLARTLEEVEPRRRADGLRRLGAVGLIEEAEDWLRLHRLLVHFVRHENLDPNAQPAVDRALIDCAEAAKQGRLVGPMLVGLIPHLIDVTNRGSGDALRLSALSNAVGLTLQSVGDLRGGRPWLERALRIREGVTRSNAAGIAQSLNNLGTLMWAQGELAAARPLLARSLALWENVLGPDHAATADSLNNLAGLLWAQGDLQAARSLLERSLLIRERVMGAEHPQTARSLSNLALVLMTQGELAAARPLLERSLAIREHVLGADHPDTAASLNNLANLLRDQGQSVAAKALCERALAIWERVQGPEHPDTAHSLQSLALLLRDQYEVGAARTLCERALSIREQVLGPHHPHTATSLHHLAILLRKQGEPAAATSRMRRALAIRERVLGPDHPDAVASRRALDELAAEAGCSPADA